MCGWAASCEHAVWVPSPTTPGVLEPHNYKEWKRHYGYNTEDDE